MTVDATTVAARFVGLETAGELTAAGREEAGRISDATAQLGSDPLEVNQLLVGRATKHDQLITAASPLHVTFTVAS